MYKLLIVDDEEEVRKAVIEKIDWGLYGYQIVGEAENGREALEIIDKVVPDVVITDIKMPFMDGLQLSEILKYKYPVTKIIILTGFDEFEYAQKAIKTNVAEYILKPVSSNDIIEVLIRLKSIIDGEIAKKEDLKTLRENYNKMLPLLREKFLTSLLTSRLSKAEIIEKSCFYGVDICSKGFVVALLTIDYDTIAEKDEMGCTEQQKLSSFHIPEDRELLKFAALNITEEIVKKYELGITFLHNDLIAIIFKLPEEGWGNGLERPLSVLEEIRFYITKYFKFAVTVGLGTCCDDASHIADSYENAMIALDYSLILGKNRTIYIGDIEPGSKDKIVFNDLKEHALASCIKVGTSYEIKKVIDGLFKEFIEAKASFKDCQICLLQVLTTILKVAGDLNIDMENVLGKNYNLFVEIYKFTDLRDVMHWLLTICTKIMGYISKERQDTCKALVNNAKEYLQEHYHDSEMTLEKVSNYLHISPTYFSAIFKKETRLTFINYLTLLRMDAAKMLLRTTSMKTFEIAESVGYSEPNYFSYCFKKNFNISPSEYRNNI